MPRFTYRAVTDGGEVVRGEMEAPDTASLVRQLRGQGYWPLHTAPAGGNRKHARAAPPSPGKSTAPTAAPRFGRRKPRGGALDPAARSLFTRELATLLGAGLPLDRALSSIARQTALPGPANAAADLLERVRGGSALAEALAARPESFPRDYVGLVRAGEAGGHLANVLTDLADSEERARALNQDVRSALTYPTLVLIVAGLSIVILLVAVVPEFEPLFAQSGGPLPWSTRMVLAASDGFRAYWWTLPVLAGAAVLAVPRLLRLPGVRARLDAMTLRLPRLGAVTRKAEAVRFCRTLGTLLANGVDVVPALDMTVETLRNTRIAGEIASVAPRLKRGEGLAAPLAETGALPPLALQLLEVGESSGRLAQMLGTAAAIYEQDLRQEINRLVALLVPAVTLFLGVIVAALIGSILSAILSSYDLPM